jgi:membrane-associated phospholipid phosphatase
VLERVKTWDRRALSRLGSARRPSAGMAALRGFSGLARGAGWVAAMTGLALAGERRARPALASVSLAFAASLGVELGVKLLVHRRRPDRDDEAHEPGPEDMERHSFPSGHALGAFACAAAVAAWYPRSAPLVSAVAAPAGASRVYLRRHNPSDVAGGALLGVALGAASSAAVRGLAGRRSSAL